MDDASGDDGAGEPGEYSGNSRKENGQGAVDVMKQEAA